jgi:hypothetical protein
MIGGGGASIRQAALERGENPMEIFNHFHPLHNLGFKVIRPTVTGSGCGTFNECERKYFFEERMGLRKKGEMTPEYFLVGEMVHEAMRVYSLGKGDSAAALAVSVIGGREIDDCTIGGVLPPGVLEHVDRCTQKSLAMAIFFRDVLKKYGEMFDGEKHEVLGAEVRITAKATFEKGIGRSSAATIGGQLDLVTRERATGEVTLHDYKQTGGKPLDRAKTVKLEKQPWMYRLLWECLEGVKATKFKHYILKRPTIRQHKPSKSKPEGETFQEYVERMKLWYLDEQQKGNNPLVISTYVYPTEGYPSWFVEQLRRVAKAGALRPYLRFFPPTGAPHRCVERGGECQFLNICTSDPVTWVEMIAGKFKRVFRYDEDEEKKGRIGSDYSFDLGARK